MPERRRPGYTGSRLPIDDPGALMNPYPCQSCKRPFKNRKTLATHKCDPYGKGAIPRQGKMTSEIAEAIRQDYARGGVSYSMLAERYQVDGSTVGKIVRGDIWRPGS